MVYLKNAMPIEIDSGRGALKTTMILDYVKRMNVYLFVYIKINNLCTLYNLDIFKLLAIFSSSLNRAFATLEGSLNRALKFFCYLVRVAWRWL